MSGANGCLISAIGLGVWLVFIANIIPFEKAVVLMLWLVVLAVSAPRSTGKEGEK